MNIASESKTLTMQDVANQFHVNKATVCRWIQKGVIPFHLSLDHGKRYHFEKDVIDNFIPPSKRIEQKPEMYKYETRITALNVCQHYILESTYMHIPDPSMLDVSDVAEAFNVTRGTVTKWVNSGMIKSYYSRSPDRKYWFYWQDVKKCSPPRSSMDPAIINLKCNTSQHAHVEDPSSVVHPAPTIIESPDPSMITAIDAANILGVSAATVARRAQMGDIKAYTVMFPMKKYFFKRDDIEHFMESNVKKVAQRYNTSPLS